MQQRQLILAKFPREDLGRLEVKDYADDREDRSTLSWLLAKGTPALGDINGVAFRAIGIHKLKRTGLYRSTLKEAGEANDDWIRLRAAFVECCELAAHEEWEAIDKVSVSNWIPPIRTKLLQVYFPEEVLPIYTPSELNHFLDALDIPCPTGTGKWVATSNRKLLEYLRAMPEISDWGTMEMAALLRGWFPKSKVGPTGISQPEMVLKAMREMVELDPVENEQVTPEKVRGYVLENYGMDIAACGTVMADMVAPGLTQTRTSKVPLHLRLLERVSSGIYRLLPAADELLSDIQDHEPSPPFPCTHR